MNRILALQMSGGWKKQSPSKTGRDNKYQTWKLIDAVHNPQILSLRIHNSRLQYTVWLGLLSMKKLPSILYPPFERYGISTSSPWIWKCFIVGNECNVDLKDLGSFLRDIFIFKKTHYSQTNQIITRLKIRKMWIQAYFCKFESISLLESQVTVICVFHIQWSHTIMRHTLLWVFLIRIACGKEWLIIVTRLPIIVWALKKLRGLFLRIC